MIRQLSGAALLSALWICFAGAALAAPLPSGLTINGSVSLDTTNSLGKTGSATQAGTIKKVIGGAATASSFTDAPGTLAPSALTGVLGATGDGFGAALSMSGNGVGTTDGLFVDYLFNLANTSLTETYVLTFHALMTNAVTATGSDAFAQSRISVLNAALIELVFSDYSADTVNPASNFSLDSATNTFSLTLSPGISTSFSALQSQRGGSFDRAANYAASFDGFIQLRDIEVRGVNTVPLPSTLLLTFAAGLGLLASLRRRT